MVAKKIIKKIMYYYIKIFARKNIYKKNKTDVLFLHMAPERIDRTKKIASMLEDKGLTVVHRVMDSIQDMFVSNLFYCENGVLLDVDYSYFESYANYLTEVYNPKIVITFNESTVFNLYLRKSMKKNGGKIINMAHGIVSKEVLRNNDKYYFDYYFVFGQSSLDNAINKKTYGKTKIVKVGSFFMDYKDTLPIVYNSRKVLFCSQGDKIDKKVNESNLRNVEILCEWANKSDYEVLFKFHPLEDENIVKTRFESKTSKFNYLPKEMSMYDAMKEAHFVIMSSSNSSLEVALLKKPIVLVNDDQNEVDSINAELEKYYLKSAINSEELESNIEKTLEKYNLFVEKGEEYVSNHIEVKMNSTEYITKCILSIVKNNEDFDYYYKKDCNF